MDAKTRGDCTSWPNWATVTAYAPPAFGTMVSDRAGLPYRADIDGLRAVAVLLVVGFHAFRSSVPGGFVGVDIFFVISGFLITGIILDAQEKCAFSFRQFYMRRIRRIFPALIIVLTFTFLTSWHLLLPDKMISLGRNLLGGAFFLSNIVLLNETGYFDIAASQKPLLHLWSLGVEEQFYILAACRLVDLPGPASAAASAGRRGPSDVGLVRSQHHPFVPLSRGSILLADHQNMGNFDRRCSSDPAE
jgi:hypothetical protein